MWRRSDGPSINWPSSRPVARRAGPAAEPEDSSPSRWRRRVRSPDGKRPPQASTRVGDSRLDVAPHCDVEKPLRFGAVVGAEDNLAPGKNTASPYSRTTFHSLVPSFVLEWWKFGAPDEIRTPAPQIRRKIKGSFLFYINPQPHPLADSTRESSFSECSVESRRPASLINGREARSCLRGRRLVASIDGSKIDGCYLFRRAGCPQIAAQSRRPRPRGRRFRCLVGP
jgi:hypothetical protein